ncbi:hypothetical protein HYH02_002575 [Chlamydomonas schloesseri]|uniref:SAP domain-containing protein n=1 Tax=Chlamydomonas schloesseri TaxID=2026947 RepID=A0A835WSP3_9CHLO|nr:hypothetical protein HYH02_002575 [Chlamydomonas schloesseri]|eukprot:KAG2453252.1 hypothetical protein HYH02_002575 [Chlamydomonas schloesseri]
MLHVGQASAGRPVAGSRSVAKGPRPRQFLVSTFAPSSRRLLVEAKRGGRSTSEPSPPGGDDGPTDALAAAEALSFRDLQAALKERGLPAGGKREELVERLAAALEEEEGAAGRGAGGASTSGRGGAAAAIELDAALDLLEEVAYGELKALCGEVGLPATGKKAELQQRLAEAAAAGQIDLLSLLGGGDELDEEEVEVDGDLNRAGVAGAAARGSSYGSAQATAAAATDAAALLPELLALSAAELEASLAEYGVAPPARGGWRGNKQAMAQALADAMVAEVTAELEEGGEAEYAEEEGDGPDSLFDAEAELSDDARRRLLAAEAEVLREQLRDNTRVQLYGALKAIDKHATYSTRGVLLDRLVRAKAEAALEAALQAAAESPDAAAELRKRIARAAAAPAAAAADGAADGPGGAGAGAMAVDYNKLAVADLKYMRVTDMRAALEHFGLDSGGNKYDMLERLKGHLIARDPSAQRGRGRHPAAAAAGSAAGAAADAAGEDGGAEGGSEGEPLDYVLSMNLRALREELDRRGLSTAGGRTQLQQRLIEELRAEADRSRAAGGGGGEGHDGEGHGGEGGARDDDDEAEGGLPSRLAALAELPLERRAAAAVAAAAADPAQLLVLGGEAPVDVAVVAGGCPPGRLDAAAAALDAARAALDALYTAHMISPLDAVTRPDPETVARFAARAAEVGPAAAAAELEAEAAAARDASADSAQLVTGVAAASAAPAVGGAARPPTGTVVSVWWLDGATGAATLLSPAQVYAATAAELAAGCLPGVHPGLLGVPPPSPLSLSTPALDGPVLAKRERGSSAATSAFGDVQSLAQHLKGAAHVVFPAVPAGGEAHGRLMAALDGAGVGAVVGSGAQAAALTTDRLALLAKLAELHYPVSPLLHLSAADVADAVAIARAQLAAAENDKKFAADKKKGGNKAGRKTAEPEQEEAPAAAASSAGDAGEADEAEKELAVLRAAYEAVKAKVASWFEKQGYHPERQLVILRPRHSGGLATAADAATAMGAERAAALATQPLVAALEGGDAAAALGAWTDMVLEAVPSPPPAAAAAASGGDATAMGSSSSVGKAGSVARFVCTVVETPDGPVALLPTELQVVDTDEAVRRHMAEVAEWEALKQGASDAEAAEAAAEAGAEEPEAWRLLGADPRSLVSPAALPSTVSARLHTPPRFSRKLAHAVRHAAAKLFGQLGLRDVASVEGWALLPPGYEASLQALDEDGEPVVATLWDEDPHILQRLAKQEAERIAADPSPLEAYYDAGSSWHADLDAFDPGRYLSPASNGDHGAGVLLSAVDAAPPLARSHPAVLAAAELGLPHPALLRNLANSALRRAAAAGDERALTPGEEYVSPEEVADAAAITVAVRDALGGAADDEASLAAQAAAVEAAAAPLQLPPAPLQLPMPPALPLYQSAVLQHLREGDEYDQWVETVDPDYWDDAEGPLRVAVAEAHMEQAQEEESGLPRAWGDDPAPMATDMAAAVEVEGQRLLLDAAVAALGEFGEGLASAMRELPLEDALEEDAEISLRRVRPLPGPEEVLGDGRDGTADDPRVAAGWQLAAISELARRHGWELLECADAAQEEADRAAAGVPKPSADEAAAALAAAEAERLVLEAMCEDDDEVMELRTGLVTPVQVYLRFKARMSRREPTSHPLLLSAATTLGYDEFVTPLEGEREEERELVPATSSGKADNGQLQVLPLGEDTPFGPGSTGDSASPTHPAAYVFNVPPDDAVELDTPMSAALLAESLADSGADGGLVAAAAAPVLAAAAARMGLPARGQAAAAGGTLAAVAAAKAGRGRGSGGGEVVAAEVVEEEEEPEEEGEAAAAGASASAFDASEAEALALMELGFSAEAVGVDESSGLPLLAAVGPSIEGLHNDLVLGGWGGAFAELPAFRPLAAILEEAGLEAPGAAGAQEDEEEEQEEDAYGQAEEEEGDDEEFGEADRLALAASSSSDAGASAYGDASGGGDDELSPVAAVVRQVAEDTGDDAAAVEAAAQAAPLAPTRVWVVVGGDAAHHAGREAGLIAGANVLAKLGRYQDLVVEPFLMVPHGEGRDADARRAELLRRRTQAVSGLGLTPGADMPAAMSDLSTLRATAEVANPSGRMDMQPIYAVTPATLARSSVPDALWSVEANAAREGVALHSLTELQRQQRAVHRDVQAELAAAGFEGVAGMWDGNITGQPGPPPARPLDLTSFAEDAARAGAVVLVAGRGSMAECGALQALLQLNGVPFVGPGPDQLALLWDKGELADLLEDLSDSAGVAVPPRLIMPTATALVAADLQPAEADKMMMQLRAQVLGADAVAAGSTAPLLVRPAAEVAGVGVARLDTGADVAAYVAALRAGDEVLPADSLSHPHPEVRLPPLLPLELIFEPYVEADSLMLVVGSSSSSAASESGGAGKRKRRTTEAKAEGTEAAGGSGGARLQALGRSGWVEVCFSLIGPLGAMSCLPPSVRAAVVAAPDLQRAEQADAEEQQQPGGGMAALLAHSPVAPVCPPPAGVLAPEVLAGACQRAVAVADRLALRGCAQVEAFVSTSTGELLVYDINPVPDLGPDSVIYRQAAAAGLLPADLLRQLLGLAIQAAATPQAAAATFEGALAAMEADAEEEGAPVWDDVEYDEEGAGLVGVGADEDDDVEEEGGLGGLDGDEDGELVSGRRRRRGGAEEEEEEDMLGQLEEMRGGGAGADAEEEEAFDEDFGEDWGGAGAGAARGSRGAGNIFFEEDGGLGGGAGGGIGGGYMPLSEAGRGGRGAARGGRGRFDDDDE